MSVKIPFALAGAVIGFPLTAARNGEWKCPECGSAVIVKRGKVKQAHFAHKSTSSCTGESLLHKATKEWISAHVCDPEFSITSRCHCCSTPITVFRGSAALSGATETTVHYSKVGCANSSNEYHTCTSHCTQTNLPAVYRVDAAAMHGSAPAAYIEVTHTHGTTASKMAHLASVSYNNAFEVKAIDLVSEAYPLKLLDVRHRRCRPCLRKALAHKRAAANYTIDTIARSHARRWLEIVNARRKKVTKRFGRRWLLLCRVRKCVSRIQTAHTALTASMSSPCGKCTEAVQLWRWVPYKSEGYKWDRFRKADCSGYEKHGSVVYHTLCSPVCVDCGEVKKFKKWCRCERATRRPCADCSKWLPNDEMHGSTVRLYGTKSKEYVCSLCAVTCGLCDKPISKKQAKYGGACFHCNVRKKRKAKGQDPDAGMCTTCGIGIDERYTRCYSCK